MKKRLSLRSPILLIAALLTVMTLSRCNQKEVVPTGSTGCDGYTGKITNDSADKLVHTCHFIGQDSIIAWTARYQEYKKGRSTDAPAVLQNQSDLNYLLGDSSSFNRCIIKKIICDDSCIGLRVIYGMSTDKKIHVILTGVKPDYSTLYIKQPEECCGNNAQQLQKAASPPGGSPYGGAEYGQLP